MTNFSRVTDMCLASRSASTFISISFFCKHGCIGSTLRIRVHSFIATPCFVCGLLSARNFSESTSCARHPSAPSFSRCSGLKCNLWCLRPSEHLSCQPASTEPASPCRRRFIPALVSGRWVASQPWPNMLTEAGEERSALLSSARLGQLARPGGSARVRVINPHCSPSVRECTQ